MPYFDAHLEKVSKIDAPLLVCGLGGTGADGVRHIKHEFAQRFVSDRLGSVELDRPPRTAYLVLDTDPGEIAKRYHGTAFDRDSEFINLQSDIGYLLSADGHNLSPEQRIWLDRAFYRNPDLRKNAATNGAGTYRQLSRLMMFRKAREVISKLGALLTRLSELPQGAPLGAKYINVVVVTGLSGGTGSGSFLDFAYMLRQAAKQQNLEIKVDLYAVAPDVTINHHAANDTNKQRIYQINSFAALKELDYWMMIDDRKNGPVSEEKFIVDYGNGINIEWDSMPYDTVTLLCATNAQGAPLQNAYDVVLNSLSETLVFMMASEANRGVVVNKNDQDYSSEKDSYSFQSAKSNEFAYMQGIQRPYPEGYRYRAIGAYSNLGEQRNRISLEGDMLFKDVHAFCVDPKHLPTMAGNEPVKFFDDFWSMVGEMQDDYYNATRYDTAMFSRLSPWDWKSTKTGNSGNAPHGQPHDNWLQNVETVKSKQMLLYAARLREKFNRMARQYLVDNGPDALQLMLSHPSYGFLKRLLDKAESVQTTADNSAGAYTAACAQANSHFADFLASGFGSQQATFDLYLPQAQAMYTSRQDQTFSDGLAAVIRSLYDEVKLNVAERGLPYAIQALTSIGEELARDVKNIPNGGGAKHLVDMGVLQEEIARQYSKDGNNVRLLTALMNYVADVALGSVAAGSSDAAASAMIQNLQGMIDNIYHDINNMTLSSQLVGFNGINDEGVAAYVQQTIAPTLEQGAEVHFALTSAYGTLTTDNAVLSSYISVPAGATEVKNGIVSYIRNGSYSGAVIKSSSISDRIFWMNIHSGLPLCAYAFLGRYETMYETGRSSHYGVSLFHYDDEDLRAIGAERTAMYDWDMLPSPNPYMLFQNSSNVITLSKRRQEMDEKLSDAEECGLIRLDTDNVNMDMFAAQFSYLTDDQGRVLTRTTLENRLDQIAAANMTEEQREAALRAILDSRKFVTLELRNIRERLNKFANDQQMAALIATQLVEGMTPASQQNVMKARERCYRALVYYRLSKRPILVDKLHEQAELVRIIKEKLEHFDDTREMKKRVLANAAFIAKLNLYDLIKLKLSSVVYRDSLGNFENNGESNMLFTQQQSGYESKPWAGFLPLEFTLAYWLAQQDMEKEPFATLREMMAAKDRAAINADDTPEDIAMCRGYCQAAKEMVKKVAEKRNSLKKNQSSVDAEAYALAIQVLEHVELTLNATTARWEAL